MFMFRSQLISWRLRDSVVTNTLQTVFELCNRLQNYLFQNKLGHQGIGTCSYMQYIGAVLWQKGFFPDAVPTKLLLRSRVAGSSYQYPTMLWTSRTIVAHFVTTFVVLVTPGFKSIYINTLLLNKANHEWDSDHFIT